MSTTKVDEIADGIYRIHTPFTFPNGGGFSFNQYLVIDEQPLLFHTGPRQLFPVVRDAVKRVMPANRLRWIGFSHVESDESGSVNEWLAAAPEATPLCGSIAAMTSGDLFDRAPRAMAEGESFSIGKKTIRWLDAPHVPHGWECGFLAEDTTRTLFCGDILTQPGNNQPAVVEGDVLGPSEAFRKQIDYYAHGPNTRAVLEKMAALNPSTLACMHGSAWRGDAASLLRTLADAVG